jgi:hypothetical protein
VAASVVCEGGIGDNGGMSASDRVGVMVDADRLETVRWVVELTGRSEDEVVAAALDSYLDDQVMEVVNEEVRAVRAERVARAARSRAAS